MAWYINVSRNIVRALKSNGMQCTFAPHERVWVDDDQFTSAMQDLVNSNILRYRGNSVAPAQTVTEPLLVQDRDWIDMPTADLDAEVSLLIDNHIDCVELRDDPSHDILLTPDEPEVQVGVTVDPAESVSEIDLEQDDPDGYLVE